MYFHDGDFNLDVLVEVHVERSIERSAIRRDMNMIPGWNPRGGVGIAGKDDP